jgi:exopolysaccharide biosynthesis predicted pyruvyltransferase EpsI
MFESLDRELLALSREGDLWYLPNPGNAGDSLIAVATWQRFRRLGLNVRHIPDEDFDGSGKIVLYGGGGGLVPLYDHAAKFIAANHARARKFVVLPHTIDGNEDLLASMGSHCLVFCREPESYRHCVAHARGARVELSHDLAFGLDPSTRRSPGLSAYLGLALRAIRVSSSGGVRPGPGLVEVRRLLTRVRERPIPPGSGDGSLDAFREDRESARASVPEGNQDLSKLFALSGVREADMAIAADLLLRTVAGHRKVRTDRLHVCIAACLLGVEVDFHRNSYFKCRAIWEHSIRGRYPKVNWIEG